MGRQRCCGCEARFVNERGPDTEVGHVKRKQLSSMNVFQPIAYLGQEQVLLNPISICVPMLLHSPTVEFILGGDLRGGGGGGGGE